MSDRHSTAGSYARRLRQWMPSAQSLAEAAAAAGAPTPLLEHDAFERSSGKSVRSGRPVGPAAGRR